MTFSLLKKYFEGSKADMHTWELEKSLTTEQKQAKDEKNLYDRIDTIRWMLNQTNNKYDLLKRIYYNSPHINFASFYTNEFQEKYDKWRIEYVQNYELDDQP